MSKLIFYDIPTKEPRQCWSLNLWKTRLALNFKNIDYETFWIEYPDIEPFMRSQYDATRNVPPNEKPDRPYTLPAIKLPSGEIIMESLKIARKLGELYPEPSLHLNEERLARIDMLRLKLRHSCSPAWVPWVPSTFLSPKSKEFFMETRKIELGKSLEEIAAQGVSEEKWKECEEAAKELGELLEAHGGPFFLGSYPSYDDLVVVAMLHMFKMLKPEEVFDPIINFHPALGKLYNASAHWFQRNK